MPTTFALNEHMNLEFVPVPAFARLLDAISESVVTLRLCTFGRKSHFDAAGPSLDIMPADFSCSKHAAELVRLCLLHLKGLQNVGHNVCGPTADLWPNVFMDIMRSHPDCARKLTSLTCTPTTASSFEQMSSVITRRPTIKTLELIDFERQVSPFLIPAGSAPRVEVDMNMPLLERKERKSPPLALFSPTVLPIAKCK